MSRKVPKKFLIMEALKKPLPKDYLSISIPAQMASAGPPIGPHLGRLGLNINAFCKDFNSRTEKVKKGIPLPCELNIRADRTYDLAIYHPTSEYLLKQAAGVKTESWDPTNLTVGRVTIKHIYEICKLKKEDRDIKLIPLRELVETYIKEANALGIEVVRELVPEEYDVFLKDRNALVEEHFAAIEAEREEKLYGKTKT